MRTFDKKIRSYFNTSLPFTTVTSLYAPSPVDEFKTLRIKNSDGSEALFFVDDIHMLLNQQRLSSLGSDTLNSWIESLSPRSDSLSQLRGKCTDEQLLQVCKSRFIQSPSELLAWSDYLNANFSSILDASLAPDVSSADGSGTSSNDSKNE